MNTTNYRFTSECRDKALALANWRRYLATRPVAAQAAMAADLAAMERFVLDAFEETNGVALPIERICDLADEDTGDTLCLSCLGSGEGSYSGSRCRDCGGRGEV